MRRLGSTALAVLTVVGALSAAPGGAVASPSAAGAAGPYAPLPAARVVDTRVGLGVPRAPLAARATVSPTITGRGGVPASGVAAVLVTLTVVTPRAGGYVTLFQAGTTRPVTADVDFATGRTRAGTALVPVDGQGRITVYNGSDAANDLVLDVSGYVPAGAPDAAGSLHPLRATRIVDTRSGAGAMKRQVPGQTAITVAVAGHGGVPGAAAAAVMTVTAARAAASGWLTVYPAGSARPAAADVNFGPAQTIANLALAKLGTGGAVTIYNGSTKPADIVVDVSGYVGAGSATAPGSTTAVVPNRILDTRTGNGAPKTIVAPRGTTVLTVAGRGGVPATGVSAVALTVTSTASTASGSVTAYADQTPRPATSNLSHAAAVTTAGFAIVPVGADGRIALYNGSAGSTHLVAEVAGYVRGTAAPDTVAPGPVTGVVATPGTTSVALSWTNPPTTDLAGVTVRRGDGTSAPSTPASGAAVAEVGPATHAVTDAHRPANSTATYALFAHDAAGNYAPAAVRTVRLTTTQAFTGTVRAAATGAPLAGVRVTATNQQADETPITDTTDSAGRYQIAGVRADADYQVCFDASALPDQPAGGYELVCPADSTSVVFVGTGMIRSGVDASLSAGGAIAGTVTDRRGTPVAGVAVRLDDQRFPSRATTGPDGTYRITGVAPGRTGVCFGGHSGTGGIAAHGYRTQCFPGDEDNDYALQTVPTIAGSTTAHIDAHLTPRTSVTGTVLGPDGIPQPGATLRVPSSDPDNGDAGGGGPVATADAQGRFLAVADTFGQVSGLCAAPAGSSRFEPACVTFDPSTRQVDGSFPPVVIRLGSPARQSVITGRVTDRSGHPVQGVVVVPYDGEYGFLAGAPRATSAADGTYTLTRDPGSGPVCFYGRKLTSPSPTGYQPACHDDVASSAGHTTAGVNIALYAGAAVTGVVTDAAGTPLPGLRVFTHDVGGGTSGDTSTDTAGRYRFAGLPAGSYAVDFRASGAYYGIVYDGGSSPTGYLDQCYRPSSTADCGAVAVTGGHTTTASVRMVAAGGMSGTVTDEAGHPVRHATVFVVGGTDTYTAENGVWTDEETTGIDGRWTAARLMPGHYAVCVVSDYLGRTTTPYPTGGYVRTCVNDVELDYHDTSAYPLVVRSGSVVNGVDVTLRDPTGVVRGTVTDGSGHPVAGVEVDATSDYSGGQGATTAADGSYEIDHLTPADDYSVCAYSRTSTPTSETGYLRSCLGGDDSSERIDVPARTTVDVDLTVQSAGGITGRVVDDLGRPLFDVDVIAYTRAGQYGARTDQHGDFAIRQLPAGDYKLQYDPSPVTESNVGGDGVAGGWSGGGSDYGTATSMPVTLGSTTRGDATLARQGSITGRVVDDSGAGVADALVGVTDDANNSYPVDVDSDGSYVAADLPGGVYTVCFATYRTMYGSASECYRHQASEPDATPVQVRPGERTAGIDGTLVRLAAVTATVSDDDGRAVYGVMVQPVDSAGEPAGPLAYANDETGVATSEGVTPGAVGLHVFCFGYTDQNIPLRTVSPGSLASFGTVTISRTGGD